jgi:hypothetical protein
MRVVGLVRWNRRDSVHPSVAVKKVASVVEKRAASVVVQISDRRLRVRRDLLVRRPMRVRLGVKSLIEAVRPRAIQSPPRRPRRSRTRRLTPFAA